MSRLLLTGVSGFLGWRLARGLKDLHEILGTYKTNPVGVEGAETAFLDLRDPRAIRRTLRDFRPDTVLHTAAITNVRFCQDNPAAAREANLDATVNLTREAEQAGARLIYTSTDRVFNGTGGNYTERDEPDPLDRYGQTKLAGERAVSRIAADHLIVRLPLMFGPPSPAHESFISWTLDSFRKNRPLELFTDQFRTPLYAGDAAEAFGLILSLPDMKGLYHLGGSVRLNRAEFGYLVAEVFGFDPSLVRPISMADKPGIPPCPADVSLNSEKFFRATGFRARPPEKGLAALKTAWGREQGAWG